MKINFTKHPGGVFTPASDSEAKRLERFKNGEVYEGDFKAVRNPGYHRKSFAFFNFCFEYWAGNEHQCEQSQREAFRKQLTILAGFYDTVACLRTGKAYHVAQSLSFGSMNDERFAFCMNAIINASLQHIFHDADQGTINKLYNFL